VIRYRSGISTTYIKNIDHEKKYRRKSDASDQRVDEDEKNIHGYMRDHIESGIVWMIRQSIEKKYFSASSLPDKKRM
jgi:hypothetical protein